MKESGERFAVCHIIQHHQFDGGSVMALHGISLEGGTDVHAIAKGT